MTEYIYIALSDLVLLLLVFLGGGGHVCASNGNHCIFVIKDWACVHLIHIIALFSYKSYNITISRLNTNLCLLMSEFQTCGIDDNNDITNILLILKVKLRQQIGLFRVPRPTLAQTPGP